MFFRKLRYWIKYRKSPKLFGRCIIMNRGEIKRLFPGSESPFMALTKMMDKVPKDDPVFKFSILGERDDPPDIWKSVEIKPSKESKIPFDWRLKLFRKFGE